MELLGRWKPSRSTSVGWSVPDDRLTTELGGRQSSSHLIGFLGVFPMALADCSNCVAFRLGRIVVADSGSSTSGSSVTSGCNKLQARTQVGYISMMRVRLQFQRMPELTLSYSQEHRASPITFHPWWLPDDSKESPKNPR